MKPTERKEVGWEAGWLRLIPTASQLPPFPMYKVGTIRPLHSRLVMKMK